MSGGKNASKTGNDFREKISQIVEENYRRVGKKILEKRAHNDAVFVCGQRLTLGKNIFGKPRSIDFILWHPVRWPDKLIIRCRWQAVNGTVEQKLPFEVHNIKANGVPTIIVFDGGGFSDGAFYWLKEQKSEVQNLAEVFTLAELKKFNDAGKL